MQRTIEEDLAVNGHSFLQTVGNSMEPLLHNRKSTVVVAAKHEKLKRYDVALYRWPTGEYVLHRVVKVLDNAYLIRGDNCVWDEVVPDERVIGVMTHYYPTEDGKPISCNSESYHRYLKTLWWRYPLLRVRTLLGKARRKVVSLVQNRKGNKKKIKDQNQTQS